jgi:hypothetical protein
MRGVVGILLLLLVVSVSSASAQINTKPIVIDNRDGCGNQRAAVEAGRDSIRRDRSYRESDKWFQDRLAALRKCIDEIPKRQAQYQAEKRKFETTRAGIQDFANTALVWMLGLLPVAIFLSYAQSAGMAGNGALVRLRDWKGQPLFLWLPLFGAAVINGLGVQVVSGVTFDASTPGTDFPRVIAGIIAIGLVAFSMFTAWQFIRDGLWATIKGIFILIHYLFARHPVQQHLPAEATEAIARGSFGHAIRTHDVDYKGFWRELVTPAFVRRHKLERAAQVKAQLDADAGILKSAIERESLRATYLDKRDNP